MTGPRPAEQLPPVDPPLSDPAAFDALTEEALRAGGGLKWTRYGPAIGAFVAEMDFGTAPAVTAALHEAVDRGRLGYLTTEAATDMARACAGWQLRRYGWDVPPDRITHRSPTWSRASRWPSSGSRPRAARSCCPRRRTCPS